MLDVHVDPGEIVAPGGPVVTVADVTHPYVDVFVPQGEIAGFHVGARARVRIDATDATASAAASSTSRDGPSSRRGSCSASASARTW